MHQWCLSKKGSREALASPVWAALAKLGERHHVMSLLVWGVLHSPVSSYNEIVRQPQSNRSMRQGSGEKGDFRPLRKRTARERGQIHGHRQIEVNASSQQGTGRRRAEPKEAQTKEILRSLGCAVSSVLAAHAARLVSDAVAEAAFRGRKTSVAVQSAEGPSAPPVEASAAAVGTRPTRVWLIESLRLARLLHRALHVTLRLFQRPKVSAGQQSSMRQSLPCRRSCARVR